MKMKFIKKNKYAPQKRTFTFLTQFDIEFPIPFMHSYIDSFAILAEHITVVFLDSETYFSILVSCIQKVKLGESFLVKCTYMYIYESPELIQNSKLNIPSECSGLS